MNKYIATIFIIAGWCAQSSILAATCTPADLVFCAFPTAGFKVGRINDLDLGDGIENVDTASNQLQIDAARFSYDETQIHTSAVCNTSENSLIGTDVEIAFTLDSADVNNRTISEIWILPCSAVQPR